MKATIIFDKAGNVWTTTYGEGLVPEGLSAVQIDVPANAQITGVEIGENGTITPKYESMPLSDWQMIQKAIDDANKETLEKVNEQINPSIDFGTCSLEELIQYRINESKEELACYLENHPLVSKCHGGKTGTYTITQDKQNQFMSKFTAHMELERAGVEDTMTWNETGKNCEAWTDEECRAFIEEWNAITSALVNEQQNIEMELVACETKEDALNIEISYEEADPRNN